MDIKRVKLTLLVLAALVISSYAFFTVAEENSGTQNNIFIDSDQDGLSDQEEAVYGTDPRNSDTDHDGYSDGAEVKSGYDPLKPSPGDKIVVSSADSALSDGANAGTNTTESKNLTREVAQKVAALTNSTAANADGTGQSVTMDQVKSLVDESLSPTVAAQDLPQISPDEIKIKKQNYSKLPESEAKKRKKEDFTNYIVAVYYILSSNSPKPISSSDSVSGLANDITQEIVSAIEKQDPGQLQNLSDFGTKVLDQLKTVEVPEDIVDIHTKALRFAKYAITLKDAIKPNDADPLAAIAQFSKIESLLQELLSFSADVESKFSSYGLNLDDTLKNKMASLGVEIPQIDASVPDASSSASVNSSDSNASTDTGADAN